MSNTKRITRLWTAAGLLLSLGVLLVVFSGLAGHVTVTDGDGIAEAADTVLRCVKNSDWSSLESVISGGQLLPPQTGKENTPERLIWDAYQQSLQWQCGDGFEIHDSAVTQKVTVRCLDIRAVTAGIAKILPEIAEEDRDHALTAAALQVLSTKLPVLEKEITMSFVREDSQWKAIPNKALLQLLSGFTNT